MALIGGLINTESLFSDNQLWPQGICWATNWKIYFLTADLTVIMTICRATRKICFLTTTHGHLLLPRVHEYVTACMCSWCNLLLLWGARAKSANKSVWKFPNTNWIMTALHYVNAIYNILHMYRKHFKSQRHEIYNPSLSARIFKDYPNWKISEVICEFLRMFKNCCRRPQKFPCQFWVGGTPLYGLYQYVRPQRVWFVTHYGQK